MDKRRAIIIIVIAATVIVAGCAAVNTDTDYDDGFYHWGKGKTDWTTRY